jgi:hypothetical protein
MNEQTKKQQKNKKQSSSVIEALTTRWKLAASSTPSMVDALP